MHRLALSLRLMAGHVGELLTKYLFPDDAKGFSAEPDVGRPPARSAHRSPGPQSDR